MLGSQKFKSFFGFLFQYEALVPIFHGEISLSAKTDERVIDCLMYDSSWSLSFNLKSSIHYTDFRP